MILDGHTPARELAENIVRQCRSFCCRRTFNPLHPTTQPRADNDLLPSESPFFHAARALVKHEVIRRDLAGDDGLAEAGIRVHDDFIPRAGDRVGGEHDARDFGGHQALDDDREFDGELIHLLTVTIGNCAIRPQRGPTAPHGVQ